MIGLSFCALLLVALLKVQKPSTFSTRADIERENTRNIRANMLLSRPAVDDRGKLFR